jgi:hypothetical protein
MNCAKQGIRENGIASHTPKLAIHIRSRRKTGITISDAPGSRR